MGPRHIMAEHVRADPAWGGSIADAISIDTWRSGGYRISGYEVKCSRSDWLRELRDPAKSAAWSARCHYWWVVADRDVVREDVPAGWGFLELRGGRLQCIRPAPLLDTAALTPSMVAGMMRAVHKTSTRRATP